MLYSMLTGLFGRSSARKRSRPARKAKRFSRSLEYLQLEDRWMLASILGTGDGFAVLAGSTVTNTGPSIIAGNVGVSPGTAVVGFPPGVLTPPSVIHAADAVAVQAQSDVTIAYNDLAGRASNFTLTGQDLGGLTLTPGVYTFATSAQLTGILTLDAQGVPGAEFIFQIGSTLTTASNSSVVMINGADSCNVYWQVGSSATLGTNSDFAGNILALTSITLNTGADIPNGRVLARNGAVTLDDNEISIDGCASITWEKRATDGNPVLLAGASFSISPNPQTGVGTLMVVDGGANDADGVANGVLAVMEVLMGAYIITETAAPPGYAIDDDPTRSVTVTPDDFHAVIGVMGVDDPGNTDESDFHNILASGSIAWEKRDHVNALQGGATFTITPDPTDGAGVLTIVDNGVGDANPVAGQFLVNNVLAGAYVVTETVAPTGFAIDDDPTRAVVVTLLDPDQVIGVQGVDDPGDTDESDFHNRLGSISWEKRASDGNPVLLPGATFEISPNPLTGAGTLTVVDGGVNDADGLANGVLRVNNVLLGTYTITETVAPVGYALDDDPTRSVTVSAADLNAVVGVQGSDQPGDTDESDFHNRLGSISWEKRASDGNPVLLPGATFVISPNPLTGVGTLTVVDGGVNDADGLANGVLQVNNVLLGTYTITETVAPVGYALDDDPTRSVTVSAADLNAVVGVQGSDQPGNTNESDFHNNQILTVGSIAWEKRDNINGLQGGATFTITPDPTDGLGILTIVDNGAGDDDPDVGQILVNNVLIGSYVLTETVPPAGFIVDDDSTRAVTVSLLDPNQVIGVQGVDDPGNTDESDFHNRLLSTANVFVIGMAKSPSTPQFVRVVDQVSGAIVTEFAPYGAAFRGGVRVATGDLNGDGIDEIVTAPGWSTVADVRVYDLNGFLITSFHPYGSAFNGGVQIAVADVDGDGVNDIVTVPSYGQSQVKVFRNVLAAGAPTFDAQNPYRDFLAFPASFIGGAVVAAADMGTQQGASFNTTLLDQRAEIIVGGGPGIPTIVKVFDVTGMAASTPTVVQPPAASFNPFTTGGASYQGGVSLSVARINLDLIPDITVGAGVNGRSLVDVWSWTNSADAALASLSANGVGFFAFPDSGRNAPVQVAAQDEDDDGIAETLLAVQGPGGTSSEVREFRIVNTAPLEVAPYTTIPGDFPGPYFIAPSRAQVTDLVFAEFGVD